MAPELINPRGFGLENSRPTKRSDCYALGMVIYETISGHFPFHRDGDYTVVMRVLAGEHPPRGVGFTENLWKMLELCWTPQPKNRPSIEGVLLCFEGVLDLPEAPCPWVDEEAGEDSDDCDSINDSYGAFSRPMPFAKLHGLSAFHGHRHASTRRLGFVLLALSSPLIRGAH